MPDITHDTGRVNLGSNHWMHSKVTLRQNGHIDATTHTETDTDFGGFHGGVSLLFSDASQAVIGQSNTHSFAVDGKWVGRSNRDDYWGEDIDPDLRKNIADFTIIHFWDPKYGAIGHITTQAVVVTKPLVDLLKNLKDDKLIG